jgi:hypothetical protein
MIYDWNCSDLWSGIMLFILKSLVALPEFVSDFCCILVPSEDVLYFEHFFLLCMISFIAAPGLGNQVEALARKGSAEFNVSVPI